MKAAKVLLIVLTVGSVFWGVGVATVAAQTAVPQGSTGYSTVPPYYPNEYVKPLDTSKSGWMNMSENNSQAVDTSKSGWMNMSGHKPGM